MRAFRLAPLFLLLILFGLLVTSVRALSLTVDEPAHIAVGYALLTRGKQAFWLLPIYGHPPLLNVLEAALLYLEKPLLPLEQLTGWFSGDYMRYLQDFRPYLAPVERVEVGARIPVVWLTLLLGALIYRWGKELWHPLAGLIALAVLCFDPNLLAHGALATTDVGVVALGTACLYAAWRWAQHPSWKWSLSWGLLLGLTLLAKVSGLIWAGVIGLVVLWKTVTGSTTRRYLWLTQGALGGLVGFLVLWAGYRWTWGPVLGAPGKWPAPDYWNGLIVQALSGKGLLTFALGTTRAGSRWWYFPFAFLIKNPLPFQIALALTLPALLRKPRFSERWLILAGFPALYGLIAITKGMNIGYRHLLPVHPFLYLALGEGVRRLLMTRTRILRWGIALLGLWYIAEMLRIFPYEISYFNELAGGPYNGHRYLADSNLDWGQSLKALRHWLEKENPFRGEPVYVAALSDTSLYGISHQPYQWVLPSPDALPLLYSRFAPSPGVHAIGASALQGIGVGEPDNFDWFRHSEPIARPGTAFFVYHVPPADPLPTWLAQCTVPVVPLSPQAAADGFGRNDLRMALFDCSSGWLYPTGGREPGWFALFRETALARDPFIRDHLASGRLSFEQRHTGFLPPFAVYEQPAGSLHPRFPTAERIQTGHLAFLGYNMRGPSQPDRLIEIETWWRVESVPSRPLSIMMHLVGPDGTRIVGDGLAIPLDQWQPGDIIVQRHRLPLPAGALAGEYQPLTGVYWLDTLERWTVMREGQPVGDQIPIPPLQVR